MRKLYLKPSLFFFIFSVLTNTQRLHAQFITTYAGDRSFDYGFSGDGGPAINAQLNNVNGIATDRNGNVYIADLTNNRVRRVDAVTHIISTYAGDGTAGYTGDNGLATAAEINGPYAVNTDSLGNLYIGDANHVVRKVNAGTHIITTIAGNGIKGFSGDGGLATSAELSGPDAFVFDKNGNLYIEDHNNQRIRRVDATTHIITTFAGNGMQGFSGDGGAATLAEFWSPSGLAIDKAGNLFVSDNNNARIRKIDASSKIITTIAGDGVYVNSGDGGDAALAKLDGPTSLSFDANGDLFVVTGLIVRVISNSTNIISTYAGNGVYGNSGDGGLALSAKIIPGCIALDKSGNLYIAGYDHVRVVNNGTGIISNFAGNYLSYYGDGGPANKAVFNYPRGIVADKKGNIYVSDNGNSRIRRIDAKTNIITTFAGNGSNTSQENGIDADSAYLISPDGLIIDSAGNVIFCDEVYGRIRKIDAITHKIFTVAGGGTATVTDNLPATQISTYPTALSQDSKGNIYFVDFLGNLAWRVDGKTNIAIRIAGKVNSQGYNGDGIPSVSALLSYPSAIALDKAGNIFIADAGNVRVRKIDAATKNISTICGNGTYGSAGDGGLAINATLNYVHAITIDSLNNIYLATESAIRKIDASNGKISTIAGQVQAGYAGDGGKAINALLNIPAGIAIDKKGNIYVAELGNNVIRKITSNALPITLTSFAATRTGKYSLLTWQTASEINSDYFSIEKSKNGSDFFTIGSIPAIDNSVQKQDYGFADYTPFDGINYYRIKEVDKDGQGVYSSIAMVNFGKEISLHISPNPVKNILTLTGLPNNGKSFVSVIDNNGKVLRAYNIAAADYLINVESLPAGVYYLKISSNNKITTLRFIKQ